MPPAPKHTSRWFQIGMGTVFAVVTAIATFLAWLHIELDAIAERKAFIAHHVRAGGYSLREADIPRGPDGQPLATPNGISVWPYPIPTVPFWRRWLGDEAVAIIGVPEDIDIDDPKGPAFIKHAKALFPEANPNVKAN